MTPSDIAPDAAPPDVRREALRQQMLLRALWHDARPAVVEGWLRGRPVQRRRGLQAYQAHAGALAERALAAAYPTVAQLVGDESFATLARALWHEQPPQEGDIARWGDELPAFMAASAQLAAEPYLPDVARLDGAVHRAERAADDTAPAQGLQHLADTDPADLRLQLRAGWAVLASAHPVVSIHAAHRSQAVDRFDPVRAAFARGDGECAQVRRDGWAVRVQAIPAAQAGFEQAVLAGRSLQQALDAASPGFDVGAWLIAILRIDGLAAVQLSKETVS